MADKPAQIFICVNLCSSVANYDRRHGRTARDRYRSSTPLLRPDHFHRPLHGPEGGKSQRLRARRPRNSVVGRARLHHRGGNERRHIFRHAGRRLRASQLHVRAARARHNPRAHSGQLHFHQAVLRLQSLFDLRISHRALRRADEKRGIRCFHDYARARVRRALVCGGDRACAGL